MDECISEISERFPCRTKLLREFYQLFGKLNHRYPSSLYLYGSPGIGKTSLLLQFLNHLSIKHTNIDCIEYYTPKMLYETILNEFNDHTLSENNNFENYVRCDTMDDFIEQLAELDTRKPYVIVLRNYHRLKETDANILPVLMRLEMLVPNLNICCILIGSKTVTHHASQLSCMPTINIHCEQYSKSELFRILMLQEKHLRKTIRNLFASDGSSEVERHHRLQIINDLSTEFFAGYFDAFLNVFYTVCRNVKELLYLSNANLPIYCKPVIDGQIDKNDVRKLWKNMELPFKTAMASIYCRVEHGNSQMINKLLGNENASDNSSTQPATSTVNTGTTTMTKTTSKKLELPYYTKYLLVAAYLASHNDAKIDRRLFMKHHGKQRKRLQNIRANAVVTEKFSTKIGPKAFTIDRLMGIFFAIIKEEVPVTSNLLIQISNLVRLKYLTFVSGENNVMDGSARLQCNVTLDFISLVGKQVDFNVRQYLTDYM